MSSLSRFLSKLKPAVGKVWLQLLAGIVWFGVGVMLISFAASWLKPVAFFTMLLLVLAGLSLATLIYLFGFSKLAKKNIKRINGLNGEKVCLFAFQSWTSYPLVLLMVFLGIYLRAYSPFPKPLLAILYLGRGGGLFSSSMHYFGVVVQKLNPKPVTE